MGFTGALLPSEVLAITPGFYPAFSEGYKTADNFMSFSVFLIVGGRTLITHAPILGDGYTFCIAAGGDDFMCRGLKS